MRDIELEPVGDDAFAEAPPAGVMADTTLEDTSFADDAAYAKPSLGGEYGPVRSLLLGAPEDGGLALLEDDIEVTPTPAPIASPAYSRVGRAWNQTTKENLYPWKYALGGLDSKNPPAALLSEQPAPLPPPLNGVTVTSMGVNDGAGVLTLSGPAQDDLVLRVVFRIGAHADRDILIDIDEGDTATQIAAKIRSALNTEPQISASGMGGTVNVVSTAAGEDITKFEATLGVL
jgi:hypothetical protein